MTGLHQTLIGRAITKIKTIFGVSETKAEQETDRLGETIEGDAQAFFAPVMAEFKTLTVEGFHTIVDAAKAKAAEVMDGKDLTNIKDDAEAISEVYHTIQVTAETVAKEDAKPLSAAAVSAFGAAVLSHIATAANDDVDPAKASDGETGNAAGPVS